MNAYSALSPLADRRMLDDFVNVLLVEDYITEQYIFDYASAQAQFKAWGVDLARYVNTALEQPHLVVLMDAEQDSALIISVEAAIAQRWRLIADSEIWHLERKPEGIHAQSIEMMALFDYLQDWGIFQHVQPDKVTVLSQQIQQCVAQCQLLQQHQVNAHTLAQQDSAQIFRTLEQYAGYRDRPYHPLAKLKEGLSQEDYLHYCPEFAQQLTVNWIAVQKDKVMFGAGVNDLDHHQPYEIFLAAEDQAELKQEMRERGLTSSHIAIPMHAWQLQHVFYSLYADEIQNGICQALSFSSSGMYASASMRSLLSVDIPEESLKLPIGIKALGSLRFLPIVKMINGEKNQQLLVQAQQKDPVLFEKLWWCEESQWWSYLPEKQQDKTADNQWLFVEKPTHLAAQRRHIPVELLQQPYQLIPMASLGHRISGQPAVFDYILQRQGKEIHSSNILQTFGKLCACFFEVNLRLFRLGLMGEIHGQNLCLVLKDGQFEGLLFRDHDSLRIYLPWLLQHGLQDPDYLSPHDFRNTLYHESAEALLFYIQTLGIQVNLACILETLAQHYHIEEQQLWQELAKQLQQAMASLDFAPDIRAELHDLLFQSEQWPYKQLLRPLLEQETRIGSMPSGIGKIQNPLWHIAKV